MTAEPPQRPLPRTVRALFTVLMVVLTIAVIEALSWVLLAATEGRLVGYSKLQRERRLVAAAAASPMAEEPAADATIPGWIRAMREKQALHPYLGFVDDPTRDRATVRRRSAEAASFGFARNAHPLFFEPSPERVVVAVFGGSVARQLGGQEGRVLEDALSRSRRFRGKRVAVLCLAVSGYKQPQQLMVLSYLLALGMHLDVAINLDGFNEVTLPVKENLSQDVFPFYPRSWNVRVDALDPDERRLRGEITLLEDVRKRFAAAFSKRPWRYSFSAAIVWRFLDRRLMRRGAERESELARQRTADVRGYQTRGPRRDYGSEEEMFEDLVTVWRRSSILMHQLASSRGIEYYHFLQPNQYFEGSKALTAEEKREAWSAGSPFRTLVPKGYPLLVASAGELRRRGVSFHDLTSLFADVEETVYADVCCHFNALGRRHLVEAIAAEVAAGAAG